MGTVALALRIEVIAEGHGQMARNKFGGRLAALGTPHQKTVNGTFYAIANYCPHEGGPLCSGRPRGRNIVDESVPGDAVMVRDMEFIYCPWHQWGFELATGTTAVKPEWSIRTYPVRVVGDDVLVMA